MFSEPGKANPEINKKVAVAMSGGVDSSVAAALLKKQGYDIIGITMQVWPLEEFADEVSRFGGCCSLAAVEDARRVAAMLNIPHYVLNLRSVFQETVIEDFLEEYQKGRTPNPCVRCNQYVKFKALLNKAKAIGCHYLATGHYARINDLDGKFSLIRGVDREKDQSYVLYMLNQAQLKRLLFPLGTHKKSEIRNFAKKRGLSVFNKPESQEICFIPNKSYADYIANAVPEAASPGEIIDKKGKVIGHHKGLIFYTCGQRKGLGISSEEPLYVIEIDKENNRLVVGEEKDLHKREFLVDEINFISADRLKKKLKARVQIRYNSPPYQAEIFPLDGKKIRVVFEQPQKAITPGQSAVFYDGENVVGGGTIEKVMSL